MMAYAALPEDLLDYICANAPGRGNAELAAMVNAAFGTTFTVAAMKTYKARHKIRSGIKPKPPSVFTPEIRGYIFSSYEGIPYREMARLVNEHFGTSISEDKFRWFYQNNKLRCGVRWSGASVSPGSVSKKKDGYQYIKMDDGTWRLYHHVLWEQVNGPIPPGHMVTFLDGNVQNTDISNLALISREEQMQLLKDGLRFDNPNLTKTGILIARVKNEARKRQKRRRSDEQNDRRCD